MATTISRGATTWASSPTTADGSIIGTTIVTGSYSILATYWTVSNGATDITNSSSLNQTNLLPGTYIFNVIDNNPSTFQSPFSVSYTVSSLNGFTAVYQPTLTDANNSKQFGLNAVSDGNYVAVYSQLTNGAGAVAIYKNTTGSGFNLTQTITQPTPTALAYFGKVMALSGTTLFIQCSATNTGAYIWTKSNTSEVWSQQQLLTPPSGETVGSFGACMAISGTRIAIGTDLNIYTYEYNATAWVQAVKISPVSMVTSYSYFAWGLALNGSTMAVVTDTNIISIYTLTSSSSTRVSQTWISSAFGSRTSSVALNADATHCIVGLPLNTQYSYPNGSTAFSSSGAAYVYRQISSSSWSQAQTIYYGQDAFSNQFGRLVCFDGTKMLIASAKGINTYTQSGTQWLLSARIPVTGATYLNAGSKFMCTNTGLNVVVMPTAAYMTLASTVSNISAVNTASGLITLTASGSSTPYTYSWSSSNNSNASSVTASNVSSVTGNTATALYTGVYTTIVTDAYGLSAAVTNSVQQMLLTAGNTAPSSALLVAGSQQSLSVTSDTMLAPATMSSAYVLLGYMTLPWDYISGKATSINVTLKCGRITYSNNSSNPSCTGNIRFGTGSTVIAPYSAQVDYLQNSVAAAASVVTAFNAAAFAANQSIALYVNSTQQRGSYNALTIIMNYNVTSRGSGSIRSSTVQYSSGNYSVAWSNSSNARDVSLCRTEKGSPNTISYADPGDYVITVTDNTFTSSVISKTFTVPLTLSTVTSNFTFNNNTGTGVVNVWTDNTWVVAYSTNDNPNGTQYPGTVYIFKPTATSYLNVQSFIGPNYGSNNHAYLGQYTAIGYSTMMCSNQYGSSIQIYNTTGTTWSAASPASLASDQVTCICLASSTLAYYTTSTSLFAINKISGTWSIQSPALITNGVISENFGANAAVDGSFVGISSWFANSGGITRTGRVDVYQITGTTATRVSQLIAPMAVALTDMGRDALVMANGMLATNGFYYADPTTNYRYGCVFIFKRTGTTYSFVQQILNGIPFTTDVGSTYTRQWGQILSLTPDASVLSINGFLYKLNPDGTYAASSTIAPTLPLAVYTSNTIVANKDAYTFNTYSITAQSLSLTPGAVGAGSIAATNIVGGTTPYIVSWTGLTSTSADAKSNLNPGTYVISVQDSAATPSTQSITYTVVNPPPGPDIIPAAVTNVTVYGASTGAIGLTSHSTTIGPYTYLWTSSNGGSTVANPTVLESKSGLKSGTYTFKVTDAANHYSTYSYTILQAAQLVLSGGIITAASSLGASDGSITAVIIAGGTSPYTYTLKNSIGTLVNATSGPFTGLKKDTYTFTVTDVAGSTATGTYTITENPVLAISGGSVTSVAIFGQATGAISAITATGGSGVYSTIVWSNSSGASTISTQDLTAKTGLLVGSYTLVLTDNRGISLTKVYTITGNPAIVVSGGTVTNAFGGSNGSISTVFVTGGTGVFA